MNLSNVTSSGRALLRVAGAFGLVFGAASAWAQDTEQSATQGHLCAEDQYKVLQGAGTLGCTAGDLTATISAQVASTQIGACPLGTQSTVDILFSLASGQADRYDIGFFVGENGNSAIAAGGTCSATIFPTTPSGNNTSGGKWFNADNNVCGDYNKASTSDNLVHNVKVLCQADSSGHLKVPYAIVYLNNANGSPVCGSIDDVTADNSAKCTHDDAAIVTNVFVTTAGDPACGKIMSFDGALNLVTTVITITNNSADPLFQDVADGSSFKDDLSAFGFTNIVATCTNSGGGATCPADLAVNAGVVTGTIATFPFGGSVEITITATSTPGDVSSIQNSVDLITPPTVLPPLDNGTYVRDGATGISTWAGACVAAQQLPVKLQTFDVR